MRDFRNAVVLIAGAASGIGYGLAQAFAEKGARVALADIDGQAASSAAATIAATGVDAIGVTLDVADPAAWARAVREVERGLGPIDVLCNSAGIGGSRKPALEIAPERYQKLWDVMLLGALHGVRAVAPGMKGRGGHIVSIASMAGMDPVPSIADYSTTKFAVVALFETLAMELKDDGIAVTIVCPGIVTSRLTENTEKLLGEAITAPKPAPTSVAMDAQTAGRIIRDAIAKGALYAFTHPENEPRIAGRFQRILESFRLLQGA